MPYIIYDLEFTVSRNTRYSSEIIDIGAVKVTESADGLVERIRSIRMFVLPISLFCPLTRFSLQVSHRKILMQPPFFRQH